MFIGHLPKNTHRLHVYPNLHAPTDGIAVTEAIGPFIRGRTVSILLIGPQSLEVSFQLSGRKLVKMATSSECQLLGDVSGRRGFLTACHRC